MELADVAFGAEHLGDALVGGVVVEVTHHHDLGRGVDRQHRIGGMAHDLGGALALGCRSLLAAQARRPVGHHEIERFPVDRPPHRHHVARAEIRQALHRKRDRGAALELEHVGTVVERHVHAAGIGRIVVHDAVIGRGEFGRSDHVFHDIAVLDLRNADHHRVVLVDGGDVEQHARKVIDLFGVLGRIPLLGPLGRKLLVVNLRVADRIEEVFEVVENDLVGFLGEAGDDQRCEKPGKKQFLHIVQINLYPSPRDCSVPSRRRQWPRRAS